MLEVKNLDFSYDGNKSVLSSLNFVLQPGEIVVISGSTGSGKSTFAKCLSGFIPHLIQGMQTGSITIDGLQYESMKMSEIARRVALVQQDSENQICTLSVNDEIAFGPENYQMDTEVIVNEVPKVLQAVGAEHLSTRTTYALSGGEKQRIAIASILACKPDYIIFDEPTSSLDPKGAILLREVLLELKHRNLGILVIEHNLDALLPLADRNLLLSNGNLSPYHNDIEPITPIVPVVSKGDEEPLLIAKEIGYSYGRRRAVEDVSLTINHGEIIALMGDNGSGKSTVLEMLAGLLPPRKGQISLSGVSIDKIDRRELGTKVAVVFQNPNHQIFEKTVEKDQSLAIGLLELDSEYVKKSEDALREAGLSDLRKMNPFSLSHGQKRRLNVSETCFFEPDLYFLDEPFIGQDHEGQDFIIGRMQAVSQRGGAVLLVTHNPRIATYACSRILFMDNGRILLDGAPSNVLDWLAKNGRQEYSMNGGAVN